MAVTTKLLTAEDLYALPSDLSCELVDGMLIERALSTALAGWIKVNIVGPLSSHVNAQRLGFVVGRVGFILRRNPDTVWPGDVAFVRQVRAPEETPSEIFWEIAPDLVVEIVSPSDTPLEIQAKIREWIQAGVRLLLYVYLHTQSIEVIRSLQDRRTLRLEDTLDLDEVVPGFSCPVAAVFGK
jgi:Uma2 family endonuclease